VATLTIGTASGGFFNFRGANSTPYAMGSSVAIQNTGGDISTTGGYEGIVCTQLTFQASGYTTTSSLYGNIWNSSGTSITNSTAVSAATDTTAPFGSKTFNLSDQFFSTPQTIYVGYARAAASPTAWDCVNGNNTTRTGNTAGSAPSGLTSSGTGTVFRRLVGTLTYTLYDAGNISQSASQTPADSSGDRRVVLTFAGNSPTYGKNISINWGDGIATTTVAAGATPTAQTRTYATAGSKTITTTLSHASTSVGIPDIVLTTNITVYTVPGSPTSLTATTASSSQINLSWTAPAYVGSGTVTYQLYRGATLLYNSTGTSFNDTGLSANTSYSYTVYATNTWGQGGVSNTASATTSANIPGTPTSFGASTQSESQINLSWSYPSSNGGSSITGYQIYRDGALIASPAGSSFINTYNDTGLAFETAYSYSIYAVNAIGSSASPATASATTYSGGKANIFNGSANVSSNPKIWNGSSWVSGILTVWNGSYWRKPGTPSALSISGSEVLDGEGNPYDPPLHSINFNSPGGITAHKIESSANNINWVSYTTVVGTSNILVYGPSYFRVLAINSIGIGAPSNSYNAF
jgi:hypothetical protein